MSVPQKLTKTWCVATKDDGIIHLDGPKSQMVDFIKTKAQAEPISRKVREGMYEFKVVDGEQAQVYWVMNYVEAKREGYMK